MIIYTDDIEFAREILGAGKGLPIGPESNYGCSLVGLMKLIYPGKNIFEFRVDSSVNPVYRIPSDKSGWDYLLLVKHAKQSHYDILCNACRENVDIPDRVLCLAGSGDDFHGFKQRSWASQRGNIHLVAYLSPKCSIANYGIGFMVLSAVSAVQVMDKIDGLETRAGLKWVNDVLIEGAKVCGVLAYSQSEGDIVTGTVLGIGMNVEVAPDVEPSLSVPRVACLKALVGDNDHIDLRSVLPELIEKIGYNYRILLKNEFFRLLDFYRERSIVVGRKVEIYTDTNNNQTGGKMSGMVERIGDNLELYLVGEKESIIKGRLVIIG